MRRPVDPEVLKLMLTALPNVAFDGWSNSTFVAACREADISERKARLFCPRGALDPVSYTHLTLPTNREV